VHNGPGLSSATWSQPAFRSSTFGPNFVFSRWIIHNTNIILCSRAAIWLYIHYIKIYSILYIICIYTHRHTHTPTTSVYNIIITVRSQTNAVAVALHLLYTYTHKYKYIYIMCMRAIAAQLGHWPVLRWVHIIILKHTHTSHTHIYVHNNIIIIRTPHSMHAIEMRGVCNGKSPCCLNYIHITL